jgi:hypothetical protein
MIKGDKTLGQLAPFVLVVLFRQSGAISGAKHSRVSKLVG